MNSKKILSMPWFYDFRPCLDFEVDALILVNLPKNNLTCKNILCKHQTEEYDCPRWLHHQYGQNNSEQTESRVKTKWNRLLEPKRPKRKLRRSHSTRRRSHHLHHPANNHPISRIIRFSFKFLWNWWHRRRSEIHLRSHWSRHIWWWPRERSWPLMYDMFIWSFTSTSCRAKALQDVSFPL